MSLKDKVVVPDLSPSTQARVERAFIEAVRSGEGRSSAVDSMFARGFTALATGFAVAGIAIAFAINIHGFVQSRAPLVASVGGQVSDLETGEDAVSVRFGDVVLAIGPRSAITMIRTRDGEAAVALHHGEVNCEVEPRPNRRPFWVGAADVTVRVVGTVFAVSNDPSRDKPDRVRVAVSRGKVAVAHAGAELFVSAGAAWSARDGVTTAIAAAAAAEMPKTDGTPADVAIPQVDSTPGRTLKSDGRNSEGDAVAASAPKADRKIPKTTSGKSMPTLRRHSAPDGDSELLAAMALEMSDPREAIRIYTKIATDERGARASFALYSRAYVEFTQLGDRSAALRTLDLFGRRFPKAREAQSALWLEISALCGDGRDERCRATAHSYIRRYPEGQFAAAAQKIVDDL